LKVHRRVVGLLSTNCYILEDKNTGKAVVIDPGGDGHGILEFIQTLELELQCVVLTHGHLDHVFDAGLIQAKTSVPVLISQADSAFLEDPGWMNAFINVKDMVPVKERVIVKEGDVISFGDSQLHVIETPGHSAGSISLYCPGVHNLQGPKGKPGILFSGDLIFHRSIGRTDFPGGDAEKLLASIRGKVLSLPGDTIIYPGHDVPTTVEKERTENPFLL